MAIRSRKELHTFTREDLDKIAMCVARAQIIGGLFIGQFGAQTAKWNDDGSVEITTEYIEGSWDDLKAFEHDVPNAAQPSGPLLEKGVFTRVTDYAPSGQDDPANEEGA